MHQRALGLFVLLTALFAFISGYYALTTIFGDWNELTQAYVLSHREKLIVGICAFLYALMILAIDREIVSAKSKYAALLRIPLAIAIGIVISVPLKLKILEGRINQQIRQEQIASILPFKKEQDRFITMSDSAIGNLELQINYYTKLKMEEQKRMEAEDLGFLGDGLSGIAGQGTRFGYAKRNTDNYTEIINELRAEIRSKQKYREVRLAQLKHDSRTYRTSAVYDFWSKIEAMHNLVDRDHTSRSKMIVFGLTMLFILLEVIPSIIKLLSPENEYDMICSYLDAIIRKKLELGIEEAGEELDLDGFIPIPEIQMGS